MVESKDLFLIVFFLKEFVFVVFNVSNLKKNIRKWFGRVIIDFIKLIEIILSRFVLGVLFFFNVR